MSIDKKLTLVTLAVFFAFGALSLYGIFDYAQKSRSIEDFTSSPYYSSYLEKMDTLAYPLTVALVILLSLCIPKRLVPEKRMVSLSFILLGLAMLSYLRSLEFSLGLLLVFALVVQLGVLILTLSGMKLRFLSISYYRKLGSTLVHLGIVAIALTLVQPTWLYFEHLKVFWFSTFLIALGMVLIFYFPEKAPGRLSLG